MAARTLALAAGGRARAAAAALGARLQPLAPPLGRSFPCPASSLLSPRAPPLLGPRGPGAPRLRPLSPLSFHPLAFSSTNTAKGEEGRQDPGDKGKAVDGGSAKREEEAARAIEAGAKNGAKKPADDIAPELANKKTHRGDCSTAGEPPKNNQPPGDGSKTGEEETTRAIDAGTKNGSKLDAAAEFTKKTRPGDDSTAGDFSKNNQPPEQVSEQAGNPAATQGVTFKDNPTAELTKKDHAGHDSTADHVSQVPGTPATPPCPPTVESSAHSGELPPPGALSNLPALESKSAEHIAAELLKAILAESKQNQEKVLKGVEKLLQRNSDIEKERNRIGRRNQTIQITVSIFLQIAVVGGVGFIYGLEYAVEKVRDQIHAMSGDDKTKEIMWNIYGSAFGYLGYKIASPVIFVGSAIGAGGRKIAVIGKKVAAKVGLVKVEAGAEQAEEDQFDGLLVWCP